MIWPPALPPSGPISIKPVGIFDNIEVVLDDDHAVAGVDQGVQHVQQLVDIGHVQAGGRFVEDVERLAGRAAADSSVTSLMRWASPPTKRGSRLAECDIAQADVDQSLQFAGNAGMFSKNSRACSQVISRTSLMVLPL